MPCINYIFQILIFPLLDNSAHKHAEQPRFFSCFISGSYTLAKYTKLCMVWQPNIYNMLWLSFWGEGWNPEPPPGALPYTRAPVPPTSKSWLGHCRKECRWKHPRSNTLVLIIYYRRNVTDCVNLWAWRGSSHCRRPGQHGAHASPGRQQW